jgi:hypothetical protein
MTIIQQIEVSDHGRLLPQEFRPVYSYVMRDHRPQENRILDKELWEQSGVVYGCTYRGKVVYIGSTDERLSRRISRHLRRIPTAMQATALRYRKWAENKHIVITAYRPPTIKLLRRDIKVHRAIEAALIKEFEQRGDSDWFVDRC